ncbi:MAG TPA: biotin carboxylase N-terminal domain-containing protein [Caulobacteraceae bacterium]|nr:biotin carboxylase N-terminal domain-containing protein [Caulobacteraceae bacterium]
MAPFASVLVANRGEIARRVTRTARRMGLRTIAVFSDADARAAHVRDADEAILIGPPPASESYLSTERILAAARASAAEAVHPGYGFLSENADFAEAVISAGLTWIGPPPAAIRAMGRKDEAKRLMGAAGVAVTPGYLGADQSDARLAAEAAKLGWPVLIKAVAGGGGRGMRRANSRRDFLPALASARREAAAAFGDDAVLLEKLITTPRHIEVQVFGDGHGGLVHLFERDCSLQRRHQKVIEEAPAPGLTPEVRAALCEAAVRAARAVAYQNAGTVEFIADASGPLSAERIWFMEMNTRLQVEHPVTEAITGLDLVEWQLRIAAGEPLPLAQDEIAMRGFAIEARLYAEAPGEHFRPSAGGLGRFRMSCAVRVDSGFEEGDRVSAFYDPMLAKLVTHGDTRAAARRRLAEACRSAEVWPVETNAAFLAHCLEDPEFAAGAADTGLIERKLATLAAPPPTPTGAIAAALARTSSRNGDGPWGPDPAVAGWRLNAPARRTVRLFVGGEAMEVVPDYDAAPLPLAHVAGEEVAFFGGAAVAFSASQPEARAIGGLAGDGIVRSPMPGRIAQVAVRVGEAVCAGQTLVVLEAMKMEHALAASLDGVVAELLVEPGRQVGEGALLVRVEPRPARSTRSKGV